MNDKLDPLFEGCQKNRTNWQQKVDKLDTGISVKIMRDAKQEPGSETDSRKENLSSAQQPESLSNDSVDSKSRASDLVTRPSQKQNGSSSHNVPSTRIGSQSPPLSNRSNKAPQSKYLPNEPSPKEVTKEDPQCDMNLSPGNPKHKKQKSGFCVLS